MPQVVEADDGQPGSVEQGPEGTLREVGGQQRPAHGVGEDEPALLPLGAGQAALVALAAGVAAETATAVSES